MSFGEANTAGFQEIANSIETRLAVYIQPVVRGEIEGPEDFALLRGAFSDVLVEDLLPTSGVQVGGIGNHAVKVEEAASYCSRLICFLALIALTVADIPQTLFPSADAPKDVAVPAGLYRHLQWRSSRQLMCCGGDTHFHFFTVRHSRLDFSGSDADRHDPAFPVHSK